MVKLYRGWPTFYTAASLLQSEISFPSAGCGHTSRGFQIHRLFAMKQLKNVLLETDDENSSTTRLEMDGPMTYERSHLTIPITIFALLGLYLTSLYSFLLFHSLAEFFSILVAFSLFTISWNARRFLNGSYFVLLGIAYLFIGGLDALHTLAFKGMGVFSDYDTDLPTQFWIAARYMEGLSLLAVPLIIRKKINPEKTFIFYFAVSFVLAASIFGRVFPQCYIEGVGLTKFKQISEYIICFMLLVTVLLMAGKRSVFEPSIFVLLVGSIILTGATELSLVSYISVYGLPHIVGHILKILSFYLMYRAVVVTSIVNPYDSLFWDLNQSRERLRLFIEHAPTSLAMFDKQMRYLSVSLRWLQDYNLGDRDLIGLSYYQVFPDIPEKWKEAHKRGLAGEVVRSEYDRFERADGSVQWVRWEVRPWRDANDEVAGIVIFTEDVTARKEAEEELYRSREWFQTTLGSIGDAVIAADSSGLVAFLNPVAQELTGWTSEDATGQPIQNIFRIIDERTRQPSKNIVEQVLREGCIFTLANHSALISRDGREIPIEDSAAPIRDKAGNIIGAVLVFHDVTEKRRIQKALAESEERLRLLGNNLPESAVYQYAHETDGSVRFLHFSAGVEQLNGISVQDILNDAAALHRQIPPEYFERLREAQARSAKELSDLDMEVPMRRPDGQLRWMRLHSRPRRMPDGRIVWDGVQTDVTERKQMEDELRKSRDDLELRVQERTQELLAANRELSEKAEIIELAHDAVFTLDTQRRITFWNRGAKETYGFTREEAIGRASDELLRTMFPIPIESIEEIVLEKGEWKGELKHTRANGEQIIVDSRWAVHTGKDKKLTGYLEVNRDITSRKIVEEELRKTDRAFRTLSECNQAMMRQTVEMELLKQVCQIVVDVGGYRMAWVGFAENNEKKSVLPIVSAGYDDGYLNQVEICWADAEKGRGPTGTAIRTGRIVASQNALVNPCYGPWRSEGTRRGYAASIALPLSVDGKVIGALTIYASEPDAFDEGEAILLNKLAENLAYGIAAIRLTEQRRLSEEELKVYASRLEVINEELQDFAFIASHDLQEPLRKIQTFCDMVLKRCAPALDNTGKDYLDRVVKSASRMRQLLHDLLTFSRAAAKPEPFRKLELGKIAREAAGIFEASLKETGCKVEIDDLPMIEADESQMLRLFQNLIGNALKYRGNDTPCIRVSGVEGKTTCEICVEDNGIGFEQRYAERIFKPFQRLHGRAEFDGTGMGLAICRKIVERHGGSIRAESEPGRGSKFVVLLPAKQSKLETNIG